MRFTETQVGRADIRMPVPADGDWRLPPDLVSGSGRGREWAIENLSVGQLLVTTQSGEHGPDQSGLCRECRHRGAEADRALARGGHHRPAFRFGSSRASWPRTRASRSSCPAAAISIRASISMRRSA